MPGVWQADAEMSASRGVPRVLSEFTRRRTWGELLYAFVGLFQGVFGFSFTVTTVLLGAGLVVTFVGLPLLAATGLVSRWLGGGVRQGANLLLGTDVAAPPVPRANPGLFGWLAAGLRDPAAWRARLYLLLKLPVGVVTFVVAVGFWAYGLLGLTYAAWRPATSCSGDGATCHRGLVFGSHHADTVGGVLLVTVAGLVILLAAPWATRAVVSLDRPLVRALLGPTARDARVHELERTRAAAVDDSAATLRRIERDLHDGAQARLVALAMNVGLAKEKLAEGADPAEATRLLEAAHATAKQAIVDVRDLARGIHPPVLDAGLETALATLAAHSALDVRLRTSLEVRPDPAIETMAYFCVAELLTNAAKHSGARTVTIDAVTRDRRLCLAVGDDGHGGAVVGQGTGLTGLADRVATVDGTLEVTSPAGGPTVVRVDVPLTAGRRATR